jgi:uncharacterized Tic20 family protein
MAYPYDPNRQPYSTPVQIADRGAERALSALAHGAIAFGLFGFTFPIALAISGIIWLYSRRSPEVRFHAAQASFYQCSVILINVLFIVVLGIGGGFSVIRLFRGEDAGLVHWVAWGFVIFVVWFVLSILYGMLAAVMVLMGKRFKYPWIGDKFEKKVW